MNIGIDIDDTICDTFEKFLPHVKEYFEKNFGRKIEFDLSSTIDYYNLASRFNISVEEDQAFWDENFVKIVNETEPKENAVNIIKRLKEDGHNIYLITARYAVLAFDVEELTKNWLIKNGIVFDKLIINSHNKLEIAKKENIDMFIDDSIRNCSMLSEGNIKTYIYKTVYNEIYKNDNVKKVNSWDEFYRCIKEEK